MEWADVSVLLIGATSVVLAVLDQLPAFYRRVFDPVSADVVTVHLAATSTQWTGSLPDGLGYTGVAGPETARAIASRIELSMVNRSERFCAVHAGVVAFEGRAVLLPGASMSGKSTLVQASLAAGATYLSDEFALLDADGRVHSYPRRLTIRTGSGSKRVAPGIAYPWGAEPLPVAVIGALRWADTGAAIDTISPGAAALALTANAVSVREQPQRTLTAITAASRYAACVEGIRGDATDTVALLRDLAGRFEGATARRS